MAANINYDVQLSQLKLQICDVLSAHKDVEAGSFWNYFVRKHCTLPDPKKFKVTKRSDLLELCSDVIKVTGSGNTAKLSLKTPAQSPATDNRQDGDAKRTAVAAAKDKTSKAGSSSYSSAAKEKTTRAGSSDDSSLKVPIEKSDLHQPKMQHGSHVSFYDKFYAAGTAQSSASAAGSHQKDNIARENPSLRSVHKREQSAEGHRGYGAGGANVATSALLPDSGKSSGSWQQFTQNAMYHKGTNQPPASLLGVHEREHSAEGHRVYGAGGASVATSSLLPGSGNSSGSWQQFTQNAMYHKVTNQPPAVRSNAITSFSVTNDTSYRPTPKVPASAAGGRKMNFSKQQVVSAAEDCIDRLSAAKDYVSLEKIEKLLLQHFEVDSLQQLNLRHLEELSCVNEHVRLLCKVNTYIQNFIKVGCYCLFIIYY